MRNKINTRINFHQKNKHKSGYDIKASCDTYSDFMPFIFENEYQTKTINFWAIPNLNLCLPILGRVDYIHHIADLSKTSNISTKTKAKC